MEKIYAMSFNRQKALEKLDELSLKISEHIFKICVLPKHESMHHWQMELKAWRRQLTKYNNSKMGKPNYNKPTLRKYLYEEPLGTNEDIAILKKMIEDDYGIKIKIPVYYKPMLIKYIETFSDSVLNNDDTWMSAQA